MQVQNFHFIFLRTFEEHFKRKIQDLRNIEHFFQFWDLLVKFPEIFYLLIYYLYLYF